VEGSRWSRTGAELPTLSRIGVIVPLRKFLDCDSGGRINGSNQTCSVNDGQRILHQDRLPCLQPDQIGDAVFGFDDFNCNVINR